MTNILTYVAALILAVHGVVHLLGTAVYLQLTEIPEFTYKTTLFGGAMDVGDLGIQLFGIFWAIAAVGFVAGAAAVVMDWNNWRMLLVAVTVFSLLLTLLDYRVAYAGVIVNIGILAALALSVQI